MSDKRDPRVCWRTGDILAIPGIEREIDEPDYEGDGVVWFTQTDFAGCHPFCHLPVSTFLEWSKSAEVLHAAD
jgi:hypothetical protein